MIDKNPHHGSYCAATGQLSLRVRHRESPPATRSMNPGYFHEKQKKNRTKLSSQLRFNSPPSHRPFPHSCIYKGTNSRLGWTKSSDLYEIVHPSLVLISLRFLVNWSMMRERSIASIRQLEILVTACASCHHCNLVYILFALLS